MAPPFKEAILLLMVECIMFAIEKSVNEHAPTLPEEFSVNCDLTISVVD